jgi:hypothetical protein
VTGALLHIPLRSSWRCEVPTCAAPWPCPPAQAAIVAAITSGATDRAGQTMYLSGQMLQAVAELTGEELPDPHGRFLGWLPHGGGGSARVGLNRLTRGTVADRDKPSLPRRHPTMITTLIPQPGRKPSCHHPHPHHSGRAAS